MDTLDNAIIFATQKHSGCFRKGSDIPYIVHPLEALIIASTMTTDKEILAAAVLHDTIEDTSATVDDIKNLFGERITTLVCADSENKREGLPAIDTWEIRKKETLDFTESASREEQIIILSDKLANMRTIYRDYLLIGDNIWNRFNQKDKSKHGWYYSAIRDRLQHLRDTAAFREYVDLIKKVFNM